MGMTFGEKLQQARNAAGMTQKELAQAAHLSLRTITNYETGGRLPPKPDIYRTLALVLGVEEDYLRDVDTDFVVSAQDKYGTKGRRQAEEVIRSFRIAAASGELDDSDLDFIKEAMLQTYEDAKRYNQRFVNNRYKKRTIDEEN